MTSTRADSIRAAKIVVAGGFGAGKTTFIGSVSDVVPLRSEALSTEAAADADDLSLTRGKETTTVAMDFGRITIDDLLVLYLFGTPGQRRYWFMWDEVTSGGIGAVVLADVRRLADAFPAVDYFDARSIPYVVAVNAFPGAARIADAELREALGVAPAVPVLTCDARDRHQVRDTLIRLVQHVAACYRAVHHI
ncbi:ATP/GTP-binding protein [Actinoplanes sp. NEAU-A12]|uniref:ATP/GTP-binding protein n=1 Tax=Actinoplanes sandaracinus TaxID=3045177 RepID=A0ABT6WM57_9ACTN|nr:ATP/GTP-binding protein [Actinoplanes sandaracinus]MDI6100814.1 ATP/GTP-binding protein [Actinoplanes sandaracinus]